jgi:flagellar motor switch protein FliN/FliY
VISLGANDAELLSPMEIDAIGEILNISLGSSATSVSQLLGQQVNITTPEVKLMKTKEFDIKLYEPAIGVEINYVEGLSGSNILILKEEDVKVIVGLLLQTDFSDKEFVMDEMNIGAICEVMNQMMGAAATALSQFLNRTINISPPNSFPVANSEQFREKYLKNSEDVVAVYFDLIIGDMVKSKFINLMRVDLAKELVSNFGLGDMGGTAATPAPAQTPQPTPETAAAPAPAQTPQPTPETTAAPAPAQTSQPAPETAAAPAPAQTSQPAPAVPPTPQPAKAIQPAQPAAAVQPQPYPSATAPAPGYSVTNAVYPDFDSQNVKLTHGESNNLKEPLI